MAGTNATVDIYNGNDRVATVPVVDGKWTATLSGLAEGLNSLVAKVGQAQSEERKVYVYPPLSFTDFNNSQWGVWVPHRNEAVRPDFVQEIENGKVNTYVSVFVRFNSAVLQLIHGTILGFATGERYRLKLRARTGPEVGDFRLSVGVDRQSYPIQLVIGGWHHYEVEFVAPEVNLEIKIWAPVAMNFSRTFNFDDIEISRVSVPGK